MKEKDHCLTDVQNVDETVLDDLKPQKSVVQQYRTNKPTLNGSREIARKNSPNQRKSILQWLANTLVTHAHGRTLTHILACVCFVYSSRCQN